MELQSLFGLPAHPLLVHVPIVLLPLVALGTLLIAFSVAMRERIGWIVVGLAAVALVGVQLAMGSGEALQESVQKSAALREHIELADTVRPLAVLLFGVVLALMLLHRRARRTDHGSGRVVPTWVGPALGVFSVLVAIGTTVQLVRVGHNGARATWQHVRLVSEEGEH